MKKNENLDEEILKELAKNSLAFGSFFGILIYAMSSINWFWAIVMTLLISGAYYVASMYSNTIRAFLLEPKEIFKNTEGLQEKNLAAFLKRRSVSDFLEYRAYVEEDGLGFYTMRDGRRGFALRVHPGSFIGENVEKILTTALEAISMNGASANFFTFASRNLDARIKEFEDIHLSKNINVKHPEVLHDLIRSRARHFKKWTNESMLKGVDLRLRDFVNVVSFSFPETITQIQLENYYAQVKGSISELYPENFTGREMITMVKEILSPEIESWDSVEDYSIEMNTQMTSEGTRLRTDSDGSIRIGETWHAKTITTKNFPDSISLADFTGIFYDKYGESVQNVIASPFLVSLTVSYDNVEKTNKKLASAASWNISETSKMGPKTKAAHPHIEERAEEAILVRKYQNAGEVPLSAMWVLTIFDNDKNRLEDYYARAIGQFKKHNWSIVQESFGNIALLSMMYSLPLNFNKDVKEFIKRFRILFLSNNTQIAPLISDARGSKMTIPFIGRSGQLQGFDFYDSDTNYNTVAAGESGSGKSYTENEIHAMCLAAGYNVRGIDSGHSYRYLNKFIGGQYIEFHDNNEICLNFFTKIILQRKPLLDAEGNVIYDENNEPMESDELALAPDSNGQMQYVIHVDEYKTIVPIIGQMAGINLAASKSNNSTLVNDLSKTFLATTIEEAIQEAYWRLKNNAGMETVDRALQDKIKALKADGRKNEVELLSMLVDAIKPYSSRHGMFYKYFNGPNNVDFTSSYVIAELDELDGKGNLYNVVLMAFAQTVMTEFFKDRTTPKIFFVDEAWKIFDKEVVVTFLNDLYRRIRKYNGIAVTLTQGIDDYFRNELTLAMYNNAAWKHILQTSTDGVKQVIQSKKAYIPALLEKVILSIKNNQALKIGEMLIRSEKRLMVARLKTDPLSHYTYAGFGKIEKPYIDGISEHYHVSTQEAVRIAALKVEHKISEDEAYQMLKGQEATSLDDIQKKEQLLKCLAVLENAIDMDRILIYSQKMESLTGGSPMYEVFVRLQKEDRTILPPATFLDHARELGKYVEITKIVINKAFEHFENNEHEFAINLLMEDISNSEITEFLLRKIKNSYASNRFIIELTSKNFSNIDTEAIEAFIKNVREYNVRVALDDIGMQSIRFDQLVALDIDIIKLESELIKSIEDDKHSLMFVEMVSSFAKKLDITTVAIHIDKESTLELVEKLGIDYAQGFLIEKPSEV